MLADRVEMPSPDERLIRFQDVPCELDELRKRSLTQNLLDLNEIAFCDLRDVGGDYFFALAARSSWSASVEIFVQSTATSDLIAPPFAPLSSTR
jgi:hypothetical protein